MWNEKSLQEAINRRFGDHRLVIVSNRQPYSHQLREGRIVPQRAVSGLVAGLEPVAKACRALWVAHGDGSADQKVTDAHSIVGAPPDRPEFLLKRVWLTKEEVSGYYYGFSNEALWPLCHIAFVRPTFRAEDMEIYRQVNRKFADAILDEIGNEKAFVWIQDYHFTLLPRYLKDARPDLVIGQFWHIPWPNPEVFRICGWREEILDGLLANDLLGFHLRYHADNFLSTCSREIDSHTDQDHTTVTRKGHRTRVQPFPMSVDFGSLSTDAAGDNVRELANRLAKELALENMIVIAGVDRVDYTKGIPERLLAISRLLQKYPQYKKRFVFVQVGAPSRVHIPKYKEMNDEISRLVEQINWEESVDGWEPIILLGRSLHYEATLALYTLADVLLVSSLHDGMNLVAKEYVAAKNELDGVLVLSQFTGAAREFRNALLINPFDREGFADTIHQAISMDHGEKQQRLQAMREYLAEMNIFNWASAFITELTKFQVQGETPHEASRSAVSV
ncbi:MAG TPA: trehalose-6-phosphate synthase [Terriglobia bacterium]|nr:trehalose-6-phosphate synthase [Terriglobia bacterium]